MTVKRRWAGFGLGLALGPLLIAGLWRGSAVDTGAYRAGDAEPDAVQDPPMPSTPSNAERAVAQQQAALAPGGMAATLRDTTEAHRNNILRLTIADAGFECEKVVSSAPVGTLGTLWRVRCEGASVYSAAINDLGRIEVAPTPYGDIHINSIDRVAPDSGQRPQLQNRERSR